MTFKLTYFNIQGAAEKVRLAFVLNEIPFEDERINFPQWAERKATSKFGQLPILTIDGGEPIAQSSAMMRYIGRLGNGKLHPTDPMEELRMNEIIGLSDDFERAYVPGIYMAMRPVEFGMPEDYGKTEEGQEHIRKIRQRFVAEKLPFFLDHFQKILDSTGDFFGGSSPSLADCQILPQLARFQAGFIDHIPTTVLDSHPGILAWMARMRALPQVAAWYADK